MGEIHSNTAGAGARGGRLSALIHHTLVRARTTSGPYRLGEVVIGDDPFNGRREGLVAVRNGTSVGLKTGDRIFFYDHRQLKRPD